MITKKSDGTLIHHQIVEQWQKEKPYKLLVLRKFLNKWFGANFPTVRIINYKEWDDRTVMISESHYGYGDY